MLTDVLLQAFVDFGSISMFSPEEESNEYEYSESTGSPAPVSPVSIRSTFSFSAGPDFSPWASASQLEAGLLFPTPMETPVEYPFSPQLPDQQAAYMMAPPVLQSTQPEPPKPSAPAPALVPAPASAPVSKEGQSVNRKKRKAFTSNANEVPPRRPTPKDVHPKKIAHNEIERRYRNNLNDRIMELRDAVPTLRVAARIREGDSTDGDAGDELSSVAPAMLKLNKAAILSRATEYILQLRSRNYYLMKENMELKQRTRYFEDMARSLNLQAPY